MSETPSPINLSAPDASGRSPGEILRAAREAQGLSLDHLAATLKVTPAKLAALEEGRLEQLPDASFARALAQTICRVLKIDAAPVLAGLPAARVAPLASEKAPLNQPFKETRLAPKMFEGDGEGVLSRLLRPQWLAPILLLVAAAVIYLLPDSFEWPKLPMWQGAALPADQVASQASAPEQTADGVLPVPAASDAVVPDPAASAASVAPESPASETGQPALLASAPTSALGVMPAASSAMVPAVSNPAVATSLAPAGPAVSDGPVVLTVTEDSWIEVVDGSGNTRLSRIVHAGESIGMGGVSPWKLRIGHARGVQVALRGQTVDLAPFTRNNVARLELK